MKNNNVGKKTHQSCYWYSCSISMNNYYWWMWKNLLHLFGVISKTCCSYVCCTAKIGEKIYFDHTHVHTHTQSQREREKERESAWNTQSVSVATVAAAAVAAMTKRANIIYSMRGKNSISATTVTRFISLFLYGTCGMYDILRKKWAKKKVSREAYAYVYTSQGFFY